MKRLSMFLCFISLISTPVFSQLQDVLNKADQLIDDENYPLCKEVLLERINSAETNLEKSEFNWRLSRVSLLLGNLAEQKGIKGQTLLDYFEQGERYANQAITQNPENYLAFYWKASNLGRWGQIKGVFDALEKAKPMQDLLKQAIAINAEHADSYFVLGQLYTQVPGWPISFGYIDWGVSFCRKAIDLQITDFRSGKLKRLVYDYYSKLAKSLWARNWDAAKRKQEQIKHKQKYAEARNAFDKNACYEGSIVLDNISDREEAVKLVRQVIEDLEAMNTEQRSKKQEIDLESAKALLAQWQK